MTRAFNIEGLVRLQNYMGGKTLSDAQFFAVPNADVVEMPLSSGTTRGRYYRQRKPRIRPAIRKLRWRSRPLPTEKLYRNTLCHL